MSSNAPVPAASREKVEVFVDIISNTASLLSNPVLGLGDVGRITALLGFATTLVRDIAAGVKELRAINSQIKTLIAEGRGPNEEEWKYWRADLASSTARLAAVKEGL